ncbi:MAG: hypothetical protein H7Z41_13080 [Cytophagales bacterium]|nr:hypothetical protein [Armatimonadota bacterium]
MNRIFSPLAFFAATAGLIAIAAPAAHAGNLRWSGDVDDTATIAIRDNNVRTTSNAGGIRNERRDLDGRLPSRGGVTLRLRENDGRGRVQIIQQPSRSNNYTALVRIVDRDKGRDHYDFELRWDNRSNGNGRDRWDRRDNRDDRNYQNDWDRRR